MTDLLASGFEWLGKQLKTHASRAVVYQRGAEQVAVQATLGRSLLKLQDDYGNVRVVWTDCDFLIYAEDLVLGGVATLPRRGDRILVTWQDKTAVYEVLAPRDEPEWRWSDPSREIFRIHAKLIAQE